MYLTYCHKSNQNEKDINASESVSTCHNDSFIDRLGLLPLSQEVLATGVAERAGAVCPSNTENETNRSGAIGRSSLMTMRTKWLDAMAANAVVFYPKSMEV